MIVWKEHVLKSVLKENQALFNIPKISTALLKFFACSESELLEYICIIFRILC